MTHYLKRPSQPQLGPDYKPVWPPRAQGSRPFIGHARELVGDTLSFYDRCEREQGGVLRADVWGLPVCLVFDPAAIEEILIKKHGAFVKSAGLKTTERAFGRGLLTSDPPIWRRQRRIIQPTFQLKRIESYSEHVRLATQRWLETVGDDETRNIHEDVTTLCFDALTRSMFGEDVSYARALLASAAEALHGFHDYYSRWVGNLGGIAFAMSRRVLTRLGKPDVSVDPTLIPSAHGRAFRRVMRELDAFVYDLVERRQRTPGDENDLVTLLLRARDEDEQPLDTRQIRDEVVTMFLAGHETGAAAISWSLYCLARNENAAKTLGRELETELALEVPDKATAEALPYLRQVLTETLRLYPPAFRISRTCTNRCEIGGYTIDPGTEVIISQWSVQRSARYYEAPEQFRPERWTPEFRASLPRFAWFPFGGGPRTCIGDGFATMESSIVVASIVRAFELELPAGANVRPFQGVTLLPENNELPLRLRRRRALGES